MCVAHECKFPRYARTEIGPLEAMEDAMRELNRLRCQLRTINIEYSALVRRTPGEAAYARMAELRTKRHVLMACIAAERQVAAMERTLEHVRSSPLRSALHSAAVSY
jgi:hypothetical protein